MIGDTSPLDRRADDLTFLREAARDLRSVGAVAPSAEALARALVWPVRSHPARPMAVLEVGAGTGAVTRHLLPELPRGSRLDVVEANPRFTGRLRRIKRESCLLADRALTVEIHETVVEEFDVGQRYDVIISGLPLTNFAPGDVEAIMSRLMALLHRGGTLTYFAYFGTRIPRAIVGSRTERRRLAAVDEVMNAYQHLYGAGQHKVWANLPPARVWRLHRPARGHAEGLDATAVRR
ncbi:methyltransferase domain-containing protein [Micromonospora sp. NBC_01405]|uniref:class I SAM-dependent methyltransferase n=1 Tax=Micromonospora sp. NBC_01405 TaxID=2903589 RepID=UPI003243F21D